MKNKSKNGISLIVIVVTIMVTIVMAGAVIITIGNNNPVENANKAVFLNDMKAFQDELIVNIAHDQIMGSGDISDINVAGKDILKYIPSAKKYINKIVIEQGQLMYVGSDGNEFEWAKEIGVVNDAMPAVMSLP